MNGCVPAPLRAHRSPPEDAEMFARLLWASLRARRARLVLALLAVTLGVAVSIALGTLALQVGDDLARTLRAAGPNFVVLPAGARWPLDLGGAEVEPPRAGLCARRAAAVATLKRLLEEQRARGRARAARSRRARRRAGRRSSARGSTHACPRKAARGAPASRGSVPIGSSTGRWPREGAPRARGRRRVARERARRGLRRRCVEIASRRAARALARSPASSHAEPRDEDARVGAARAGAALAGGSGTDRSRVAERARACRRRDAPRARSRARPRRLRALHVHRVSRRRRRGAAEQPRRRRGAADDRGRSRAKAPSSGGSTCSWCCSRSPRSSRPMLGLLSTTTATRRRARAPSSGCCARSARRRRQIAALLLGETLLVSLAGGIARLGARARGRRRDPRRHVRHRVGALAAAAAARARARARGRGARHARPAAHGAAARSRAGAAWLSPRCAWTLRLLRGGALAQARHAGARGARGRDRRFGRLGAAPRLGRRVAQAHARAAVARAQPADPCPRVLPPGPTTGAPPRVPRRARRRSPPARGAASTECRCSTSPRASAGRRVQVIGADLDAARRLHPSWKIADGAHPSWIGVRLGKRLGITARPARAAREPRRRARDRRRSRAPRSRPAAPTTRRGGSRSSARRR